MALQTLDELTENFALFDNWEDRYAYLIDLGKQLPPMTESLKTDENIVRGCTSQVWLVAQIENGKFIFSADSDAQIVKGLVYLLLSAFQGKSSTDIIAMDIEQAFNRIGLHQHLSPNRRNGFYAMVERIRALAAQS